MVVPQSSGRVSEFNVRKKLFTSVNMSIGCCVCGCQNRYGTSGLKFYRIPTGSRPFQSNRRRLWLQAIKRTDWTEAIIKNARVCGAHFISGEASLDPSCPDFVPSIFVYAKQHQKMERYHRKRRRDDTYQPTNPQKHPLSPEHSEPACNMDHCTAVCCEDNCHRMKPLRETPEAAEERREKDRQRKRLKKLLEPPQVAAARRAYDRQRQREKRSLEPPQAKAERREIDRQRKKLRQSLEPPQVTEARREKDRLRKRKKRIFEPPEGTDECCEDSREQMTLKRSLETDGDATETQPSNVKHRAEQSCMWALFRLHQLV